MKIKELMGQQRKDIKRGVTYKSGYAIDSNNAPDCIRIAEMKKNEQFRVTCPFYGCFARGHKTTGAKNCRYHDLKNLGKLNTTINDYLANLYPENYGEFNKGSSRTHPVVPTALLQIDYCLFARGLKIWRLLFMSGVLEKKWFFASQFFLSLSLLPKTIVSWFLLWDRECIYHCCTWNYIQFYVPFIDWWILFLYWVFIYNTRSVHDYTIIVHEIIFKSTYHLLIDRILFFTLFFI